VKGLAQQTAAATDQIRQQIGGVQQATRQAMQIIAAIADTINEVHGIAATSGTAREIAQNVQYAASQTQQVSSNIEGAGAGAFGAGGDPGEGGLAVHQRGEGRLSPQAAPTVQFRKVCPKPAGGPVLIGCGTAVAMPPSVFRWCRPASIRTPYTLQEISAPCSGRPFSSAPVPRL
jgi:hypothetical protein